MNNQTIELQAVVERLERIEKQNRILRRVGLALLLLPLALLVMGQARQPRTVEAEKFVLVDSSGKTWAALQVGQTEPYSIGGMKVPEGVTAKLSFFGPNGEERMVLGVSSMSAGLHLNDTAGKPTALIANMGRDTPIVQLVQGENLLTATVGNNGPWLALTDKDGFGAMLGNANSIVARTGEKRRTSAASLHLVSSGKVLWSAP